MIPHRSASPFLFLALPVVLLLAGCNALKSITVQPAAGTVVLTALGQTAQFTAVGQSQQGSGIPTTGGVSANWSVSNPSVASISSTGLATALGAGYTQIIAESNGITATSDLTVNVASSTGGGTTTGATVTSITVIPGAQSVTSPGETTQFIAIGTTSSGSTVNLAGQVAWSASSAQIATIGASTGLAAAIGQGTATITALYALNGTTVAGTATFTVQGGTTEKYTAVTITPSSESLSASGQSGQFIALATSGTSGLLTDVSNSPQIKWNSSIPTVATVTATGLATGVSAGTSTVSVELTNTDGTVVSNNATLVISSTPPPEPLLSLTIIPSSITVGNLQDTGQFLAIGTYSTPPYVRDLTNSANLAWISTFPSVFPVDSNSGGNSGASAGLVTAYGAGSVAIIAEATNPSDGSIQTASATFNCPSPTNPVQPGQCYPGSQAPALLATLTVYNEGPNTTNWEITAPSATGTVNVLHCGPGWALNGGTGGSVCTATYPIGAKITLTAPNTGANFGGWTYNCGSQGTVTAAGPNSCTVTLSTNDTVGAIFN